MSLFANAVFDIRQFFFLKKRSSSLKVNYNIYIFKFFFQKKITIC